MVAGGKQRKGKSELPDWLDSVRSALKEAEDEIRRIRAEREARLEKITKKLTEFKKLIEDRIEAALEYVPDSLYQEVTVEEGEEAIESREGGGKTAGVPHPYITYSDGEPYEITLVMPGLTETKRMNLVFRIVFDEDLNVRLQAYKRFADGRSERMGESRLNHEEFVERTISEFLRSWARRRVADELDKERKLRIAISMHGLK